MKITAFQSEKEYKEFEFSTLEEFDYCFLKAMTSSLKVHIRDAMIFEDMYVLQLHIGKKHYQVIIDIEGFSEWWKEWRKLVKKEIETMEKLPDSIFNKM